MTSTFDKSTQSTSVDLHTLIQEDMFHANVPSKLTVQLYAQIITQPHFDEIAKLKRRENQLETAIISEFTGLLAAGDQPVVPKHANQKRLFKVIRENTAASENRYTFYQGDEQ